MMDYKELKRKEFLFEIINDAIDGMDVYNHNGSLWLIKTEELKWAIEFTKDKTLWYNYSLFKNLFKAISLDITENQKYVTEWFESRFLKPEVVEDTIQNGVKRTSMFLFQEQRSVEDTIQNGVKHTDCYDGRRSTKVEYTIQNGVKHTKSMCGKRNGRVDNIVQNGVNKTDEAFYGQVYVEDAIQNGVKKTIGTLRRTAKWGVDDIIQEGVKETHDDCSNNIARVEGIIRIGEKIS